MHSKCRVLHSVIFYATLSASINDWHVIAICLFVSSCIQHDPEQCTPGGEDGNFIMFARATSGDKRNNNRFSPCSLNAINPVLNSKARSPKGCFTGQFYTRSDRTRLIKFASSVLPHFISPCRPNPTVFAFFYCRTSSIIVRQWRGGGG